MLKSIWQIMVYDGHICVYLKIWTMEFGFFKLLKYKYVVNIYKEQIIFCSLYITDSDYRYWKERELKFWFRNWIIREPYYILNILLFMNLKMINQLMFKLINQPRSKSIKHKFYGRFNGLVSKYNVSLRCMLGDVFHTC